MYRSTNAQAGTARSESRSPHREHLLDGRAAREGRVPLVHGRKVLGEVEPVDVLHEPRRRHLVPPAPGQSARSVRDSCTTPSTSEQDFNFQPQSAWQLDGPNDMGKETHVVKERSATLALSPTRYPCADAESAFSSTPRTRRTSFW